MAKLLTAIQRAIEVREYAPGRFELKVRGWKSRTFIAPVSRNRPGAGKHRRAVACALEKAIVAELTRSL